MCNSINTYIYLLCTQDTYFVQFLVRACFLFFSSVPAAWGGGGVGGLLLADFRFLLSFPYPSNHKRDWPPCEVVFFGLATDTLNVGNFL